MPNSLSTNSSSFPVSSSFSCTNLPPTIDSASSFPSSNFCSYSSSCIPNIYFPFSSDNCNSADNSNSADFKNASFLESPFFFFFHKYREVYLADPKGETLKKLEEIKRMENEEIEYENNKGVKLLYGGKINGDDDYEYRIIAWTIAGHTSYDKEKFKQYGKLIEELSRKSPTGLIEFEDLYSKLDIKMSPGWTHYATIKLPNKHSYTEFLLRRSKNLKNNLTQKRSDFFYGNKDKQVCFREKN